MSFTRLYSDKSIQFSRLIPHYSRRQSLNQHFSTNQFSKAHFYSTPSSCHHPHEYDLIVIGGGSGGLACAKQASSLGKSVIVLDYVKPSPRTLAKWGLGGTCVNVGCIPKKLMHQAALLGQGIKDARDFGWDIENLDSKGNNLPRHSWSKLVDSVQNYIKSLNWGHRTALKDKKVQYLNAKGTFIDRNSILTTSPKGKTKTITGDKIVIAVGGRPNQLPEEIWSKAAACLSDDLHKSVITSDDLFSLKTSPGKTLVIGAGYIALESAGFLRGLGFDVTVMVRSRVLRGFDQDIGDKIKDIMEKEGVKFLSGCVTTSLEQSGDSHPIKVYWKNNETGKLENDSFQTVMLAMGRHPLTDDLNLEKIGLERNPQTGKIVTQNPQRDQSSISNIHAIGDVVEGGLELTPVAVHAGKALANRLFGRSRAQKEAGDGQTLVPTTIFTPIEYSVVGLAEEKAVHVHGKDKIEVYHAYFDPLEYKLSSEREHGQCYIKLVCKRVSEGGYEDGGEVEPSDERVVGMHILGPNAGEMMQGFAVAMRLGITREDILETIGIHPTCAEEIVKVNISKRSGVDPTVSGC